MEPRDAENSNNNSQFIYKYTEAAVEKVNRSIDIVTDKTTKVLAVSAVLMKFATDMEPRGLFFSSRALVIFALIGAIGCCAAGISPRSPGEIDLKPEYLLEEQYGLSEEEMHVMVARSWIEGIPSLKKLLSYRIQCLNIATGLLVFGGLTYGLSEFIRSVH